MKISKIFLLLFFWSLAFPSTAQAQVVINEFLPNHSAGEDWVELYSSSDVDISGWILDDYDTSTDMAVIPQGTVIGPSTSSYYTVDVGTRLNQDKDTVFIYQPAKGNPVDQYSYNTNLGTDVSFGRYPDGQSWGTCIATKNGSNSNCSFPTPTPTFIPTPSPTPIPTPAPISTATLRPASTSTPKSTQSPSPTVYLVSKQRTPTSTSSSISEENRSVLGINSSDEGVISPTVTPKNEDLLNRPKNYSLKILLIGLGIESIALSIWLFLKTKQKSII